METYTRRNRTSIRYRISRGAGLASLPLLAVAACATNPSPAPEPAASELIVFPPPPDTPRVQFLTRFTDSRDVEPPPAESGFWASLAGEEQTAENEVRAIQKPYGVAIADGRIYVCDTGRSGIDVLDVAGQAFEVRKPRGLGRLSKPLNCFADDGGNLYVADIDRGQIVVFDSEGRYVDSFGEAEDVRPADVFVAGDSVFVADMRGQRVVVFDRRTRQSLGVIPASGDTLEAARLYAPTNLFVTDRHIYVSDFGAFQVKVFDREGTYVRSVGSYGSGIGQFIRPKGIAVDHDERLYVVDAGFENVQVFDSEGQVLMYFGGPYEGPGDLWLPAKVTIDYRNLDLFRKYVHESFELKYLILVTSQYGPDKVNVYGFVGPANGVEGGP